VNTTWQSRISRPGAPAVPILVESMHRIFWVTPGQKSILVRLYDGQKFKQRELAAALGYTIGGLNDALHSLHAMGLGTLTTVRGRNGWSQLIINRAARVLKNVRTRDPFVVGSVDLISLGETLVRTFQDRITGAGAADHTGPRSSVDSEDRHRSDG